MCNVNLAEIYYCVFREFGKTKAEEILALIYSFPIKLVGATVELALAAAKIKAIYPIALGDCFAIGLSKLYSATVVTGDPEFNKVDEELNILWLPQK